MVVPVSIPMLKKSLILIDPKIST